MENNSRKLTKRVIDALEYKGSGTSAFIVFDSLMPAFGLRIFPGGNKSFVFKYRMYGQQRWLTIGRFGDITVEEARKTAQNIRAGLNVGTDPALERRKADAQSTFKDLGEAYLERHSKAKKRSWSEDERRLNAYLYPSFGKLRIEDVTHSLIGKFHSDTGKHSIYEANRCLSLISSMFNLAHQFGLLEHGHPNPAKGISKFKEKSRERWVKPEEFSELAKAISAESNVYVKASIYLFLFTGMRKSELLKAKWEHIDWGRKELRLDETKSGTIQFVSLSEPALAILKNTPREHLNPYILPGHKKGHHLVNISIPWLRIRERANLKDVHLHDLRRTFGSMLAQKGVPILEIKKLLRHSDIKTTEIYTRLGEKKGQEAVESLGAEINALIAISELV